MIEYDKNSGILEVTVFAVPRASRTEIKGVHGDALRVRIAAPPVDGAANRELLEFLAKRLRTSKSSGKVVSGSSSKKKRLRFSGVSAESAAAFKRSVER